MVRSNSEARQIVVRERQIAAVAGEQRRCQAASSRRCSVRKPFRPRGTAPSARGGDRPARRSRISTRNMLVALLQERILDGDFAQAIRMRIHQLQIFAAAARGLGCGVPWHRARGRAGSARSPPARAPTDRRPAVSRRCLRRTLDLGGALLRIHAIRFHVLAQRNRSQRVGIGISVGQVRALVESGSAKTICAPISCALRMASTNGSAGLDRDVDGLLGLGIAAVGGVVIEDDRDLRQPRMASR
jgi:hypothetical protein